MYLEFADVVEPIAFCLNVILKEAREEDKLAKQILYTMLSSYTNNPSNLAVNSPSGEGKSYVITKVGEIFPKEDVMFLQGMTEKALFHRPGVLVIQNDHTGEYEPVADSIAKIDSEIENKQNEMANVKDKNLKQGLRSTIKTLEKEKEDLSKNAKKLIDLSHKIIVFLDTPKPKLFTALMPLLSHDKWEVEYEYVDTHNGIITKSNVLRGWPAVIFAQAIDYSHHPRYPEIQRRFIITNPNMSSRKYEQAIDLIGDKHGSPDFVYQRKIVSDTDKEKAREIIRGIKDKVVDICHGINPGTNNVIIPFSEIIKSVLPKGKASDMTTANRLFGFLTLLSIINIDKRPKIVLRKKGDLVIQRIPFALFEDLSEVLSLMDYSADGVRPYQLEWYNDVFLAGFKAKKEPVSKVNNKGQTITEKIIGLTTGELVNLTFEKQNKRFSTKQILENFVNPLINLGLIDKIESELDKRTNILYPVITATATTTTTKNRKLFEMDQPNYFPQSSKVYIENPILYPTKQYIISEINRVLGYSTENEDFSFVKKQDHQGQEITVEELVNRYYKDPDKYFEFSYSNHVDDNNGNNNNVPALPLLTLLPPCLPLLPCDDNRGRERQEKDGSPHLKEMAEEEDLQNCSSKEEDSDEYFKSTKITRVSQQISNECINTIQIEGISSNKLFETSKSNNFLYSDKKQNLSGHSHQLDCLVVSSSSKQDREDAKKIILKEYPDISQSTLEFVLSIPVEQKRPKVSELEIVHATPEQQEEMEKLL